MGYRGIVRSIAAEQRRSEREARTRQKELWAFQQALAKMEERQRAAYEVAMFENQVEVVKSLHKDVSFFYDWRAILAAPPPEQPANLRVHEYAALAQLQAYKPSFTEKLLGQERANREKLEQAVRQAQEEDAWQHRQAVAQFQQAYERWQWFQRVGQGVVAGDVEAYRAALTYLAPFAELSELGSGVEVDVDRQRRAEICVRLRGESVIPTEEKRLLANGRLTSKAMPASRVNDLYQDHVCSAALRAAGEAFAVLPVTVALVHVEVPMLNTATGRRGFATILSVAVMRETFESLELDSIDCSDSMRNFVHNMSFKKSRGFEPVDRLGKNDLRAS